MYSNKFSDGFDGEKSYMYNGKQNVHSHSWILVYRTKLKSAKNVIRGKTANDKWHNIPGKIVNVLIKGTRIFWILVW